MRRCRKNDEQIRILFVFRWVIRGHALHAKFRQPLVIERQELSAYFFFSTLNDLALD